MSRYIILGLFVLFSGLSIAAYADLAYELDGSTITSKRSVVQPQREGERPL